MGMADSKKTCANGCDFFVAYYLLCLMNFVDYYLQLLLFHHKSGPMMIIYRPEETFWMMIVLDCYIWAFICISKYMYNHVYISYTYPRLELEIKLE